MIKKISCPHCKKELINLSLFTKDNQFWCDVCGKDYEVIESDEFGDEILEIEIENN